MVKLYSIGSKAVVKKFPTRCYYLRHVLYCWSNLGIANEVNLVTRYFSSSTDDFEL